MAWSLIESVGKDVKLNIKVTAKEKAVAKQFTTRTINSSIVRKVCI